MTEETKKPNKFNYDLIHRFNELIYQGLLLHSNLSGNEIYVNVARNDTGQEFDLRQFFYPLKKDEKMYLLPSDKLNQLPIRAERTIKIAVEKKGYHVIEHCVPSGFGAEKTYSSFREFIDSFCDYEHENPDMFRLWKILCIMAYISRINVRIATNPAFGKDSVLKVLNAFLGDVGIVHNPTIAKIEWLLSNKILVTNEVCGLVKTEKMNLDQYYLTCGDFSNEYTKRSRANMQGSKEKYDITKLSNVIMYNTIDCYQDKDQGDYFDKIFQKAVRERFLPFKFSGKIIEKFSAIKNIDEEVKSNISDYKKIIKFIKYLGINFEKELHHYKTNTYIFKDRALRNWETICMGIDMYSSSQEEYNRYVSLLYEAHCEYNRMMYVGGNSSKNEQLDLLNVEEVKM